MKIAILINDVLRGGAPRIVLDIVRKSDKSKFKFVIVVFKSDDVFADHAIPSLRKELEAAGARVIYLSRVRKSKLTDVLSCVRVLRAERPDVVHTFLPYAGTLGRFAARLAGVPYIISTQCNIRVAYNFREYWIDRLTLPLAHVWTAAAECIESEYGGSVEYVTERSWRSGRWHFTIVAGVDVDQVQRVAVSVDRHAKRASIGVADTDVVVLMTARLISWKGQDDLIRALAYLPSHIHAVFVGWGNEEPFRRLAEHVGVSGRVHFLGARDDVYELLGASDVFAQPFKQDERGHMWQGPNTSQMEACAARVPSVSTRVPLMEYLVEDGVTGSLANTNDPKDLARSIIFMVDHPSAREALVERAARRVAERYSLGTMVNAYEKIYTKRTA